MSAPRRPLNGRYRFTSSLPASGPLEHWLAIDEHTAEEVICGIVGARHALRFEHARGVAHHHLAQVLDVVRQVHPAEVPDCPPGSVVVVAEFTPGVSLDQLLRAGPVPPPRAVAWTLRIAEALQMLHDRGAVHWGISPWALVAQPGTRAIPPLLTQVLASPLGCTSSPEQLKGSPPAPGDDVWGLCATLYMAITGVPPFAGNTRDRVLSSMARGAPEKLSAHGIVDPSLEEIIRFVLAPDRNRRVSTLSEFVAMLDAWELGRALPVRGPRAASVPRTLGGIVSGGLGAAQFEGELEFETALLPDVLGHAAQRRSRPSANLESAPVAGASSAPALPLVSRTTPSSPSSPGAAAPAIAPVSINPFQRRTNRWPVVIGVIGSVGLALGGYMVWSNSSTEKTLPPVPSSRPVVLPAASSAPQKKEPELSPEQKLRMCVSSYFAEGQFGENEDFSFVCAHEDLRDLAVKLHEVAERKADKREAAEAAAASKKDKKPAAPSPSASGIRMDVLTADVKPRVRRPLGWYELAATAVIRESCCPFTTEVRLPEVDGWCEQLETVVRDFGQESGKAGDLSPVARRFEKAVECLFANKLSRPYVYADDPITDENRKAFQTFLSNAAISEVQRRKLKR